MKLYIDENYCCHTSNPDGIYREVDTAPLVNKEGRYFFEGKCDTYIEGNRYIPADEKWVDEHGNLFTGEMITIWKPLDELEKKQREYDRELLTDAENALAILLGGEA